MATVREIAKEAGVSPATVSRIMTGKASVKPEKEKRVKEAIAALEQRDISSRSKLSVGIILPSINSVDPNDHHSLFLAMTNFMEYMSRYEISNTTIFLEKDSFLPHQLFSTLLDGYFVLGTNEAQEAKIINYLSEKDIPCVFVNRQYHNNKVGCVCFDDEGSTMKAVSYLISLGHTKIGFIGGGYNYQNTKRRLSGYRQALSAAKIDMRDDFIYQGEYSEASGKLAGKYIAELKDKPTALYCASDSIAVGCMKYLTKNGFNLPQDMAIVSFGNEEVYQYVTPALTTIGQPNSTLGSVSALLLLQMIEMPSICSQIVNLRTDLIIRKSSGDSIRE